MLSSYDPWRKGGGKTVALVYLSITDSTQRSSKLTDVVKHAQLVEVPFWRFPPWQPLKPKST